MYITKEEILEQYKAYLLTHDIDKILTFGDKILHIVRPKEEDRLEPALVSETNIFKGGGDVMNEMNVVGIEGYISEGSNLTGMGLMTMSQLKEFDRVLKLRVKELYGI